MNETLKTIHGMHSTRSFSAKEIPGEDLQIILNAAVRAGSASAQQSYSIIVVDDQDLMKRYINYVGSRALIFCVDFNRLMDLAAHTGNVWSCNSLQQFITGSTDTILAAQNAALAARSLGIDSLFTNSVHRGSLPEFYKQFNLPEQHCFPLISLVLGYSENPKYELKGRLNGPGIVHFQSYQRLTSEELDEMVREHDDPERHLGLRGFDPDEHYIDWFFNVWCKGFKYDPNKTIEFYGALQKAGFFADRPQLILG